MTLLSELDQLDDEIIGEIVAADSNAATPDRDPTYRDALIVTDPVVRLNRKVADRDNTEDGFNG